MGKDGGRQKIDDLRRANMALRGQTKQLKKEKDDLVQENKELKQANNDLTREKGFFQK